MLSEGTNLPKLIASQRSYSVSSSMSTREIKVSILNKFNEILSKNKDEPIASVAIKTLTYIVSTSHATTAQELESQINISIKYLIDYNDTKIKLTLKAACSLFKRFISREANYVKSVKSLKKLLVNRGNFFAEHLVNSRQQICQYCLRFIHNGSVILIHSHSQVVYEVLRYAVKNGNKKFECIVTESQPNKEGHFMMKKLKECNIPCKIILDSSVASIMNNVDFVLVGSEAVVQSGGIINRIGTYQMSIIAKVMNKPFYVATESCKFLEFYPITQDDIPYKANKKSNTNSNSISKISDNNNNSNNNNTKIDDKIITRDTGGNSSNNNNNNNNNSNDDDDGKMKALDIDDDGENVDMDVSDDISPELWSFEDDRIRDYTPPQYITLIFSDLGILTPSAVSDELIKLYGN